jgi:hypothetical protein
MDSYSQQRFAALLFIGEIVGPSSKVSHGDFVRVLGRFVRSVLMEQLFNKLRPFSTLL